MKATIKIKFARIPKFVNDGMSDDNGTTDWSFLSPIPNKGGKKRANAYIYIVKAGIERPRMCRMFITCRSRTSYWTIDTADPRLACRIAKKCIWPIVARKR